MKIISWTIINNEIEFIQDLIDYHLEWLDGMYFLDNGSTDGTLEYLLSRTSDRIIVEKYHTSFSPDYSKAWEAMSNPFPEVEVRNYALSQVEKLNSDWIIQLDADEVFLKKTRSIIEINNDYEILSLSTFNPVCPLNEHPIEMRVNKKTGDKIKMWDPHARIWKPNLGFKFINNPALKGVSYHCIPVHNGRHLYHHDKNIFLNNPLHFHLHWMCYRKLESFYNNTKTIFNRAEMVRNQKLHEFSALVPKLFWDRRAQWIKQGDNTKNA